MLSGCPGALESLQAVISSVRQWNEIQLPLTRGDSKNNLNCSWIVSFWWQAPETFHHTHTPHTYTLYPHTFSRWLFGQWGGRSRILLPKRRAEQLAASWIHEISISVVCIVCDIGQQWFWSAVVDYMIIFFWYSHTLLFFFLSFFFKGNICIHIFTYICSFCIWCSIWDSFLISVITRPSSTCLVTTAHSIVAAASQRTSLKVGEFIQN